MLRWEATTLVIGIPKEIKQDEARIALTPDGVSALTQRGHTVLVQSHAGSLVGMEDAEFELVGARIAPTAADVFSEADLIVKVKEPLPAEYGLLRHGQVLFTYLHLAASRPLTDALMRSKAICIGYETVRRPDGSLPLLTPMSEVAGRLSIQAGAACLQCINGGRGVLLGGVPGVPPADVAVLGAGTVGANATKMAVGLGARVTVLDLNPDRLRYLDDIFFGRITTVMASPAAVERAVHEADLVIGAVLVPGAVAPRLVTAPMVREMKPGAALVDVAIDQGGCIATMKPTSHSAPSYVEHGVVHYGVTNMPAAVPRTSTWALTNATLPYVIALAHYGWRKALARDGTLAQGLQVAYGELVSKAVAEAFSMDHAELDTAIGAAE